jgi:hypothetical protein
MLCVLRRAARSGSGLHGRGRGDVGGKEAVLSRFCTYGSFDDGKRIGCKVRLLVAQIGEVERPEFVVVDAVPSIAMLELLKIRRVRSGKDVKRELGPSLWATTFSSPGAKSCRERPTSKHFFLLTSKHKRPCLSN